MKMKRILILSAVAALAMVAGCAAQSNLRGEPWNGQDAEWFTGLFPKNMGKWTPETPP